MKEIKTFDLKSFFLAISFVLFFANYFVKNAISDLLPFINEGVHFALALFLLFNKTDYYFHFIKHIHYVFLFFIFLFVRYLHSEHEQWIVHRYLSYFYFTMVSYVLGKNFSYYFNQINTNNNPVIIDYLRILSIIGIVSVYIFLFNKKWEIGTSLLKIEKVQEYYQGFGRVLSFFILVIIFHSFSNILNLVFAVLGSYIVLNYRSVGAFVGIILALIYSIFVLLKQKRFIFLILSFFSIIFLFFLLNYLGLTNYLVESFNDTNERIRLKMEGRENRVEFLLGTINLFIQFPNYLVFGINPEKYSCLMGYCSEEAFLYSHNIFLDLLIYFGLFGLIFWFLILNSFNYVMRKFIFSHNRLNLLIGIIFIYYFFQANIGGDFSGNRFLILLIVLTSSL